MVSAAVFPAPRLPSISTFLDDGEPSLAKCGVEIKSSGSTSFSRSAASAPKLSLETASDSKLPVSCGCICHPEEAKILRPSYRAFGERLPKAEACQPADRKVGGLGLEKASEGFRQDFALLSWQPVEWRKRWLRLCWSDATRDHGDEVLVWNLDQRKIW